MDGNILTIFIFTYNHEQFVGQCIESVLGQKCSYPYIVKVFDDCSSDKTVEIVRKLQQDNPDRLSLSVSAKNQGVLHSVASALASAKTKYFAFLDGDDYWSYNGKLQAQLDFLEANEDYAGCFHDAEIRHLAKSDNSEFLKKTKNNWKTYSQMNKYYADFEPHFLVTRTIIPTSSFICRWRNVDDFVRRYSFGELSFSWALELEMIKRSKFRYFNECWSVYNDHAGGVSKRRSLIDFKRNNIRILESLLDDDFYRYYAPEIYQTICSELRMIIKSDEALRMTKREYKHLLREYRKYQICEIWAERKQFLRDYDYLNIKSQNE